MNTIVNGFAEISAIAGSDYLSRYSKHLFDADAVFWVLWASPRDGPGHWVSATAMIVGKDISLNGIDLKKGGHLCFSKVKLKPISHI